MAEEQCVSILQIRDAVFQHGLTEKIQGTQQGHKMSHNDGTRLFSGFLVSFCQWSCQKKLLDESTIK